MIGQLEVSCVGRRVGTARFNLRRGGISTTFTYEESWLGDETGFALDPALPLVSGAHHTQGLPGSFRDSLPDRWGRTLIKKRLAQEEDGLRSLDDVDYLIGVSDRGRQGALRFKEDEHSPYLATDDAVPPLVELPRLMHAAKEVALGDAGREAIKELLDAGSGSLGGARPKASVRDGEKLMLAKFPHPSDEWGVMAWEATALELASRSGIEVPPHRLVSIGGAHVLLEERFDRGEGDERIPYLSAMSLCKAQDGDPHDYAEVADAMVGFCRQTQEGLQELWKRVAFSCAVHNTDDHLRNLGFLRSRGTWHLAPLFDVNPNPYGASERATSILGARSPKDEQKALVDFGEYLGLDGRFMEGALTSIRHAISSWRNVATRLGVPPHELKRFSRVLDR